jgi:hypothetical protein
MDPGETSRLRLYSEDAQAIDNLFRQALNKKGAGAFLEFCDFIRRFHRFSVFNAMLIAVQRPGAQAAGSRHQWARIGRRVNPDAVPIVILRPFGPVEFIYELGDTTGVPLPGGDHDPFGASGYLHDHVWDRAVTAAGKAGVAVETIDNYGAGLAGTAAALHGTTDSDTTTVEGRSVRWRVRVNRALDWPARYATLAHELAHVYCGHLGGDPKDRWPNRATLFLTQGQQELEAEATAYIVCARVGIETRSADYLALHVQPGDLEAISVFAILAAANRIEARSNRATSA